MGIECKYRAIFTPDEIKPQTHPLNCCVTIIGIEDKHKVIAKAWQKPEIKEYLKSKGFADDFGFWKGAFKTAYIAPEFFELWEQIVAKRWNELLYHIALGPTQINLVWTGPSFGGNGKNPGFPDTWEKCWDFYTQKDSFDVVLNTCDAYLNDNGILNPGLDDAQGINWTVNQTGNPSKAKEYWFGLQPQFAPGLKANVQLAQYEFSKL
jgi:hypothetical protein